MKKKSIWIIDDDSIFKIIIQKLIIKSDLFENVSTFSNGLEASKALKRVATAKEPLPDIILVDIEMPVMDGWGFLEEMNAIKPSLQEKKINIFMSSSSIAVDDKIRVEKNPNIFGYLTKPISLVDLIEIAS